MRVRLITFDGNGQFQGNSLIVKRNDIPTRVSLENEPTRIDLDDKKMCARYFKAVDERLRTDNSWKANITPMRQFC